MRSPGTSTCASPRPEPLLERPGRRRRAPKGGVARADILHGNVGYIEVVGFPPPGAFIGPVNRAMAALQKTRALIYLNDGKARFRAAGTWGAPEWSTRNASAADLNGDGRPDIIAANRPGPSFVCLNDGKGHFSTPCIAIPAGSATSIIPADFDNDRHIDLAVPERDGGQSRIYFNDGKANFTRTLPFGPEKAAARVGSAADFDADGDLDLVRRR